MRFLPLRSSARSGGVLGAVITLAALGIAVSAVVLVLSAAFGHPDSSGHSATAADTKAAAQQQAGQGGGGMAGMHGEGSDGVQLYAVQTGPLGVVVTDGEGRLLYGSHQDANNPSTSRCTAACAQEWLPVVVQPGQQPELLGVDSDKVGRVTRDDGGSQLTLDGWPVYVNKNDDGQLASAAPDAHGTWFVLTPQGGKKEV